MNIQSTPLSARQPSYSITSLQITIHGAKPSRPAGFRPFLPPIDETRHWRLTASQAMDRVFGGSRKPPQPQPQNPGSINIVNASSEAQANTSAPTVSQARPVAGIAAPPSPINSKMQSSATQAGRRSRDSLKSKPATTTRATSPFPQTEDPVWKKHFTLWQSNTKSREVVTGA